jgi:CheY-like chemotaxis protein
MLAWPILLLVRAQVVLIEGNLHLRTQLSEVVGRLGLTLSATYECITPASLSEILAIRPAAVIFPIQQAHAGQWELVRTLQNTPDPPLLMALSPVDIPSIHQSALAEGVHHIFDPLVDVNRFLATLQALAGSVSASHRQHVA